MRRDVAPESLKASGQFSEYASTSSKTYWIMIREPGAAYPSKGIVYREIQILHSLSEAILNALILEGVSQSIYFTVYQRQCLRSDSGSHQEYLASEPTAVTRANDDHFDRSGSVNRKVTKSKTRRILERTKPCHDCFQKVRCPILR